MESEGYRDSLHFRKQSFGNSGIYSSRAFVNCTDRLKHCLSRNTAHIIPKVISTSELPANWYNYPGLSDLAEVGTNWVLANNSLLLRVPSAVIKHEFNILINPSHPDMSHVTISDVEEFTFDERLLQ